MTNLELVTLNRTLAVKVGSDIHKASSFTGKFSRISGRDDVEYVINHIHLPQDVPEWALNPPVRLTFKKSAIVSTQSV